MDFLKKKQNNISKLLIISQNSDHIEQIKQRLSLQGVSEFTHIQKNPIELTPNEIDDKYWAVVYDIGANNDAYAHISTIAKIFPKDIAKVVVGDSDSIKLHQSFSKNGIAYLHFETQINEIYNKLISFDVINNNNFAIKIAVLGCKGGVGSSFCAYHMAKLIHERFNTPTLLVQGSSSSFNIDVLSGLNFDKEYFDNKSLNLYKQNNDEAFDFTNHKFNQFNFIVFDYSVQTLEKEMCEHILNNTDTAIVLTDSSVSSVRKAKEVLKINRFLKSVNKGASKIAIYLNTPHKDSNTLGKIEIEQILEQKIDLLIPYSSTKELSSKINKKTKSIFENAIDSLTGSKKSSNIWSSFSLLKGR